jgi:hypothetical protein
MKYRYEITENNELKIWNTDSGSDAPTILQPDYPDCTPWTKDQARQWGEAYIDMMTNPECQFFPGEGPDKPLIPRSEVNISQE